MDERKEVFISYASKDRERVKGFVSLLHSAGVSVWMDTSGIDGGGIWAKEIVRAIKGCKAGIVMVSPSSMVSQNVFKEVHLLSTNGKKILPLYLEKSKVPDDLEYELAGIQFLNLFQGTPTNVFRAVLQALGSMGVKVKEELEPEELFPEVDEAPWMITSVRNRWLSVENLGHAPRRFVIGGVLLVVVLTILFFYLGGREASNSSLPEGARSSQPEMVANTGDSRSSLPSRLPATGGEPESAETKSSTVSTTTAVSIPKLQASRITYAFSASPILSTDGTDFRPHLLGAVQSAFPGVIPAPLEDAEFAQAFAGNVHSLSGKSFFPAMDALVLGRANVSFQKKSTLDPDLISCNLNFSMQAFGKSGEMTGSNSFRVVGVGFSNEDAARNAMEKLMDAYGDSIFPANG